MRLCRQSTLVFLPLLMFGLVLRLGIQPALAQENQSRLPKRLVADYTAGSKYLNPPYDVAQIPFHKLTHIIHASVPWNSDGSLSVAQGFLEPELIKRAHETGVKVMLLTGGDFAAIENSEQVFDTVLENLQSFVIANGYDGVDIEIGRAHV